ncbi:MAG TPA: hypothetical protein VKR21_02335 [Solirubrobacteraceae bacterium]|nr:hypothetical protein [Solirubrobacteraceae bacterium]
MNETVSPATTGARAGTRARRPVSRLFGGGVDGNEQLTAMTGAVLIVMLAALGLTIVRIGQLIWLHLFLGLLLMGPVFLKLASTGYRFLRYYARAAIYRAKGPPMPALRAMGPVVVITTLLVFISGVVLLFNGPRGRATLSVVHKASFIVWLMFMGIHVLAHLPALGRTLRAVPIVAASPHEPVSDPRAGAIGRWLAIGGGIVSGLVLAVVLIPHFGVWTAPGAFPHHHEH